MPLIPIANLEDSRLDIYRDLKSSSLYRRRGLFVAEGKRLVRRLLQSTFAVESVVVSEPFCGELAPTIPESVPTYVLSAGNIRKLIGFKFHSGALACGKRLAATQLPANVLTGQDRVTLAICIDVTDPENLGSIVRIAAAFGIDAVLVSQQSADPYSRRVLRVSMGAVWDIPVIEVNDLASELERLKVAGFELAATVLTGNAEPIEQARRADRFALLFGNEAHGLGESWIEYCERRLTIPIAASVDSLNVSVAAGICFYHFTRASAFSID
jgi:tRNA G18 (ribose-2'-O)-methylase SpoU